MSRGTCGHANERTGGVGAKNTEESSPYSLSEIILHPVATA